VPAVVVQVSSCISDSYPSFFFSDYQRSVELLLRFPRFTEYIELQDTIETMLHILKGKFDLEFLILLGKFHGMLFGIDEISRVPNFPEMLSKLGLQIYKCWLIR
jgi:hypothetical protein